MEVSSPSPRSHLLLPLATESGSCLRASDWNVCLQQAQRFLQNLAVGSAMEDEEESSSSLKTTTDGTGTSNEHDPTITTATAAVSFLAYHLTRLLLLVSSSPRAHRRPFPYCHNNSNTNKTFSNSG
jgi:hypothetical protein